MSLFFLTWTYFSLKLVIYEGDPPLVQKASVDSHFIHYFAVFFHL